MWRWWRQESLVCLQSVGVRTGLKANGRPWTVFCRSAGRASRMTQGEASALLVTFDRWFTSVVLAHGRFKEGGDRLGIAHPIAPPRVDMQKGQPAEGQCLPATLLRSPDLQHGIAA